MSIDTRVKWALAWPDGSLVIPHDSAPTLDETADLQKIYPGSVIVRVAYTVLMRREQPDG
jgi:hypothetical protein